MRVSPHDDSLAVDLSLEYVRIFDVLLADN